MLYSEPVACDDIVYQDEDIKLQALWKWNVDSMYKSDLGVLKVLGRGEAFNHNGTSTIITLDGKRITSLDFANISDAGEGLLAVGVWGKGYGYINKEGEFVIPPQYDSADEFEDGLARVASFLRIFGIEQYEGDETGTTIVIPYINEEELLSNNRVEYLDDQEQPIIPFWGHRIEDYISISAQRWYSPRLNNSHYQQGAFLRMRINGKGISRDEMEPVFRVVQSLYNMASYVDEEDILADVEEKKREPIVVRKYLEDTSVGVLAFAKVSRQLLGIWMPRQL